MVVSKPCKGEAASRSASKPVNQPREIFAREWPDFYDELKPAQTEEDQRKRRFGSPGCVGMARGERRIRNLRDPVF